MLDLSLDESIDISLTVSLFESLMEELSELNDPLMDGGGEWSSVSLIIITLLNLKTDSLSNSLLWLNAAWSEVVSEQLLRLYRKKPDTGIVCIPFALLNPLKLSTFVNRISLDFSLIEQLLFVVSTMSAGFSSSRCSTKHSIFFLKDLRLSALKPIRELSSGNALLEELCLACVSEKVGDFSQTSSVSCSSADSSQAGIGRLLGTGVLGLVGLFSDERVVRAFRSTASRVNQGC